MSEKSCKHTRRIEERLRDNEVIRSIRGSEVTFNEEAIARKVKALPSSDEDATVVRVKALMRALESV